MTTLTADDLLSAAVKRELVQVADKARKSRLARLRPDGQAVMLPATVRRDLNILVTGGYAQLGQARVQVPLRGGPVDGRLVVVTGLGRAYLRNWQQFGPCGDEDPELFFPASYEGPGLLQVAKAKAVCHGCPVLVRARCLREHMTDQDGIVGGTTPAERRDLRRRELGDRLPVSPPDVPAAARATEPEWDVQTDSARHAAKRREYQKRRWAQMTPEQQAEYRARMAAKNRAYRARARAAAQGQDAVQRSEGVA